MVVKYVHLYVREVLFHLSKHQFLVLVTAPVGLDDAFSLRSDFLLPLYSAPCEDIYKHDQR